MDSVAAADGLNLRLRRWRTTVRPHGQVQIVHGLGEHIGRYDGLARALNAAGWQVAGHDLRGHGRSDGPRGGIPDRNALLSDVALVMDALREPGPHVLLGHSLGGLVAARFVAESLRPVAPWARAVDGLVLSSPALDPGLSPAQKLLLAVAAPLAPRLALGNGLKPQWISRDPAVVQAYVDDPLVHDRVTPGLVRFLVEAAALVAERAPRWRVPTLLMWAGADLCVAPRGSAAFADAAPPDVLVAQAFPKLYHEIFNEPERAEVISHLLRWLARFDADATPGSGQRED